MSVHVLSWVLKNSDERLGRRLVLIALADHARDDGTGAWPSVMTISRDARMSEPAVQYALRDLEKAGAIEKTGVSKHGTVVWRVVMGAQDSQGADPAGAKTGAELAPDPSLTRPSLFPSTSLGAREVGGALGTNQPTFPVKEVNRKKVTDGEAALARAILAAFNAKFETDYRGREHAIDIVMRIRERPDLSLDDHVAIIERFAGETWWRKGKRGGTVAHPSVAHLYGSGKALDAAINAKRKEGDDGQKDERDLSIYDRR